MTISLDNVTEAAGGAPRPNPVIYTSRSRTAPYDNVLELTVTNDTGRDLVMGPARPAFELTLPSVAAGFTVGAIEVEGFVAKHSDDPAENCWDLFPQESSPAFVDGRSLVITLREVAVPQPLDSEFVRVLPDPDNPKSMAWTQPLFIQDAPQPGDRELHLRVDFLPGRDVVFHADGEYDELADDSFQQVGLHIYRDDSKEAVHVTGTAGANLCITACFGEELGDLLPAERAGLVELGTVRDYGNRWAFAKKRLAKAASWEAVADKVFLRAGTGYELRLKGIFPNAKEGYANLYIEYKNLRGYRGGVIVKPVFKRLRPQVDFAFTTPGPFPMNEKGEVLVPVKWDVRNVGSWSDAVDIRVEPLKEGVLRLGVPQQPVVSGFPTNRTRGTETFQLEGPRRLVLSARDRAGPSVRTELAADVSPPTVILRAAPMLAPFEEGGREIAFEWTVENAGFLGRLELQTPGQTRKLERMERSARLLLTEPCDVTLVPFDRLDRPCKPGTIRVQSFSEHLVGRSAFNVRNQQSCEPLAPTDRRPWPGLRMHGWMANLSEDLRLRADHTASWAYRITQYQVDRQGGSIRGQRRSDEAGEWRFQWRIAQGRLWLSSDAGTFGATVTGKALAFDALPPLRSGVHFHSFPYDIVRTNRVLT